MSQNLQTSFETLAKNYYSVFELILSKEELVLQAPLAQGSLKRAVMNPSKNIIAGASNLQGLAFNEESTARIPLWERWNQSREAVGHGKMLGSKRLARCANRNRKGTTETASLEKVHVAASVLNLPALVGRPPDGEVSRSILYIVTEHANKYR